MEKRILFLMWGILLLINGNTQSLKPSVIASDGGVSKLGNISLEWTLGEFAVETISSVKNLYTQGFHQPILAVKKARVSSAQESVIGNADKFKILLAPNPTRSFVHVYITSEKSEVHILTLFDLNGKKVLVKQGFGKDYFVRIDMEKLVSGIYLLQLMDKNADIVKSYKIVKAE